VEGGAARPDCRPDEKLIAGSADGSSANARSVVECVSQTRFLANGASFAFALMLLRTSRPRSRCEKIMRFSSSLPKEVLKMSLDSIMSHKFRSGLTILGIVIGVITAIVVASILTGMRQSIVSIVEEYGTNNIYVFHLSTGFGPRSRDERNRKPLTEEDAEAILAQSSAVEDIALVAPNIGSWGTGFDDNLVYEGKNYRWALTDGVTPNYMQMTNLVIKQGRWITEADNYQRRNVLVVGVNTVEALFPTTPDDVVGRVVKMNGTTWEPQSFSALPNRPQSRADARRRSAHRAGKTRAVKRSRSGNRRNSPPAAKCEIRRGEQFRRENRRQFYRAV
jgi:hypothetical protein